MQFPLISKQASIRRGMGAFSAILLTTLAHYAIAQEKAPVRAIIERDISGPIPLGGPVVVSVRLRNDGDTDRSFTVSRTGLPLFMSMGIRNSKTGEDLEGRPDGWVVDRFSRNTKAKGTYNWKRGSEFVVRYDLRSSAVFPGPGRYTVHVEYAEVNVGSDEVTIAPELSESISVIEERCAHPSRGLSLDDFSITVKAELRTGKVVSGDGTERWYTQVAKVRSDDDRNWYGSMLLECPTKVHVKKSEIDYRWRVWTVLESGAQQALAIWDLRTATVSLKIPWQEHTIELGGVRAEATGLNMVIGGLSGDVHMSSLSVE